MAKEESTARLAYNVHRSLMAQSGQIRRQREQLHGIDQPSHPRKKKSSPNAQATIEDRGHEPRNHGEETELDIVEEIKGTGARGLDVFSAEGARLGTISSRLPSATETRISRVRRQKREKQRGRR